MLRNRICRISCLFLCILLLCSCNGTEPANPTVPVSGGFDYATVLWEYEGNPVNVQTKLTCALPTPVELNHTLTRAEDGSYTATDLATGLTYTASVREKPTDLFARACYVPPYDVSVSGEGGVYTAHLDGEEIRTLLLNGSHLFSGYAENPDVMLQNGCTYTVYATEDVITSYSYAFTLNVTDGEDSFTVDVNYEIEVKR